MTQNEIKKALYKQKPEASLLEVTQDGIRYMADIEIDGGAAGIYFVVPLREIGEVRWSLRLPSQLLVRYIEPVLDPSQASGPEVNHKINQGAG